MFCILEVWKGSPQKGRRQSYNNPILTQTILEHTPFVVHCGPPTLGLPLFSSPPSHGDPPNARSSLVHPAITAVPPTLNPSSSAYCPLLPRLSPHLSGLNHVKFHSSVFKLKASANERSLFAAQVNIGPLGTDRANAEHILVAGFVCTVQGLGPRLTH